MKKIIAGLLLIIAFAGCSKNKDTTPSCSYDPCAYVVPANEIQNVKKYLDSNGIAATQHCSGMFYVVSATGSGKQANACSTVSVQYRGELTNGKVFDQQTMPTTFDLNNLIAGWRNGIPLIKEGGSIRLFIPPSLGYGSSDIKDNSGNVIIPANSILIFDISLVSVN